MLEQDITVSQKLKVEVSRNSESGTKKDYAEVIPQIEEEKHSIQHRYISMKARNWEDSDDDYYWELYDLSLTNLNFTSSNCGVLGFWGDRKSVV